jgi:hypothetical protein
MARPKADLRGTDIATDTPATDDKVLLTAYVDKDTAKLIDEFRWTNRIEGRAETVRQLVIRGLHATA